MCFACDLLITTLNVYPFERSSGSKATHPADDLPLPEDPDAPFHGFPVSVMDLEHEPKDFEGWDLTTPFR